MTNDAILVTHFDRKSVVPNNTNGGVNDFITQGGEGLCYGTRPLVQIASIFGLEDLEVGSLKVLLHKRLSSMLETFATPVTGADAAHLRDLVKGTTGRWGRVGSLIAVCIVGAPSAVWAEAQVIEEAALPSPQLTCPESGYAPPVYGFFGRNAGDGLAPVEVMSPCTPIEVRNAADAIGMARSHQGAPLTLKAVVTAMFSADGYYAIEGNALEPVSDLEMQIHYGLPAARLRVPTRDGEEIRVFNDTQTWSEKSEGVADGNVYAANGSLLVLTKLTPFGALWSLVEAEGHATVVSIDGDVAIQGASPYDGLPVTVTLDENDRPKHVIVASGEDVYEATFSDYTSEFEPAYLFVFPKHIEWVKNGEALARLDVTSYKTNPYVVFPVPQSE